MRGNIFPENAASVVDKPLLLVLCLHTQSDGGILFIKSLRSEIIKNF